MPEPIFVDPNGALEEYRTAIDDLLQTTLTGHYIYKKEVMTAIRALVDEVRIYPTDHPDGRDEEITGDIEALVVSHPLGIETMVPRGGIEPPTRGFSNILLSNHIALSWHDLRRDETKKRLKMLDLSEH